MFLVSGLRFGGRQDAAPVVCHVLPLAKEVKEMVQLPGMRCWTKGNKHLNSSSRLGLVEYHDMFGTQDVPRQHIRHALG